MEYRQLGGSGLKVPVLCLGTGTFGGGNDFFRAWGTTDESGAKNLIAMCLESGVNFFDTADVYSNGLSEELVGKAIAGKRDKVIISSKGTFRMGDSPNDLGSSRHHITRACEDSLRRLNTDYIDIYTMHGFDAQTPVQETLHTLESLVQSGKVGYIACSNFSGWHLMKSLAISERYGWSRYAAHQANYSLLGREYEWELMPLGLDQRVSTLVWGPLATGQLTGKIRRNKPAAAGTRIQQIGTEAPPLPEEFVQKVVDALDVVANETGKTVAQVALNWVLNRPTVASVIIGARDEAQLRENLGSEGWKLTEEQITTLDAASEKTRIYPYWHQLNFERNPLAVSQKTAK